MSETTEKTASALYDAIAEATAPAQEPQDPQPGDKPRKRYTAAEAETFKGNLKTSGRKGVSCDRINLAFTPENYKYVQTMARVSGDGMTKFINRVLEQHREANAGMYERALQFLKDLEGYKF